MGIQDNYVNINNFNNLLIQLTNYNQFVLADIQLFLQIIQTELEQNK